MFGFLSASTPTTAAAGNTAWLALTHILLLAITALLVLLLLDNQRRFRGIMSNVSEHHVRNIIKQAVVDANESMVIAEARGAVEALPLASKALQSFELMFNLGLPEGYLDRITHVQCALVMNRLKLHHQSLTSRILVNEEHGEESVSYSQQS